MLVIQRRALNSFNRTIKFARELLRFVKVVMWKLAPVKVLHTLPLPLFSLRVNVWTDLSTVSLSIDKKLFFWQRLKRGNYF